MMEENVTQRACPKDCRMCTMQQQMFCSAQMSFNMFEVMSNIMSKLDELGNTVKCLKSTGDLATPPRSRKKEISQMGSGE